MTIIAQIPKFILNHLRSLILCPQTLFIFGWGHQSLHRKLTWDILLSFVEMQTHLEWRWELTLTKPSSN